MKRIGAGIDLTGADITEDEFLEDLRKAEMSMYENYVGNIRALNRQRLMFQRPIERILSYDEWHRETKNGNRDYL